MGKLLIRSFTSQAIVERFSSFGRKSAIIDEERRRGYIDSLAIPLYNPRFVLTGLEGTPNRESITMFFGGVTVHQLTLHFSLLRIAFALIGHAEKLITMQTKLDH